MFVAAALNELVRTSLRIRVLLITWSRQNGTDARSSFDGQLSRAVGNNGGDPTPGSVKGVGRPGPGMGPGGRYEASATYAMVSTELLGEPRWRFSSLTRRRRRPRGGVVVIHSL